MAELFFIAVANLAVFGLFVGLPPYMVYRYIRKQELKQHK